MRLALISDTHGWLPNYCPLGVDAVIHAGDIGPDGRMIEWWKEDFVPWAEQVKVPIYATFGNHDFKQPPVDLVPDNVQLIVDTKVEIDGLKVWFSPWVTNLPRWAWNLSEDEAKTKYATIPTDIDILVSHAPPFGVGDSLRESATKYGLTPDTRVGGTALREWLESSRKTRLLQGYSDYPLVICGHIHEDRGIHVHNNLVVINVASVDGSYQPQRDRWTLLEV